MEQWTLLVDCKEPDAKQTCQYMAEHHVTARIENLAVGDYGWLYQGKLWCILERKKRADFEQSIEDGRYDDQVARITKSGVPHQYVLVVGAPPNPCVSITDKALDSAIMHIQMATPIKFAYVQTSNHVDPYLLKMSNYLCNNPAENCIAAPFLEEVQSTCRKRRMTSQPDVFQAQLMCIDGVSNVKAKVIAEKFVSMRHLLEAYDSLKDDNQKQKLLAPLQSGKKKLGPKLSAKVYYATVLK